MRILITGGAGFIGSVATNYFIERNFEVNVIDNLSTGTRKFIPEKANFFEGDIRNKTQLMQSAKGCDAILHLAGLAIVPESFERKAEYFDVNTEGTKNLIKVIEELNINSIIFSSTCAVYGESYKVPISEEFEKLPCNPYGESKLLAEDSLLTWQKSGLNRSLTILRFFNVSGAYDSKRFGLIGENRIIETHLIPNLVKNRGIGFKLTGKNFQTKDGTAVRDYIHVEDLCSAFLIAFEKSINQTGNYLYNLGTGRGYSVLEVIRTFEELISEKIKFEILERRIGDPHFLVADAKRALQDLNWQPKSKLTDILESTYTFFTHK